MGLSLSRKPGSGCLYFVDLPYAEGYVNWTGFLQAKFPVLIVRITDILSKFLGASIGANTRVNQ